MDNGFPDGFLSVLADSFSRMTQQLDDERLDGSPAETLAGMPAETPAGMPAETPAGESAETPAGESAGVRVDVTALLDTIVERRTCVDRAEADLLGLAVEFADACPERVDDGLLTSLDGPGAADLAATAAAAGFGPTSGPTGGVEETAVVGLAARLAVSYRSAADLLVEALELRDRLPRLWGLVQAGRLQAWKARQVTRATLTLSDAAASFVDAHAAVSARRNQVPDLRKLVILAINRCDPDLAEGLEEAAAAERGVRFEFSASTDAAATARLEATLDLLDALDLDATVTDLATQMGRLGDDSPIGVRRAHALGMLGNPQRTLDLFGDPVTPTTDDTDTPTPSGTDIDGTVGTVGTDGDTDTDDTRGSGVDTGADFGGAVEAFTRAPRPRPRMPWDGQGRWNSQIGHLFLHLDAADLRAMYADGLLTDTAASTGASTGAGTGAGSGCGGVDLERLGAASLTLVRDWLGRATRVSVRPVLHLDRDHADHADAADHAGGAHDIEDAVDQHDPPEAMREQVILRDGACMFPGCRTHARACDVDHIDPYIPLDHGGPPGQTRPGNLACLCRRHHRMKTHHGWDYHRARDGTYAWTDPRGTRYTTSPTPLHDLHPRTPET